MNLKNPLSAPSETPPLPIADVLDDGQMTSPAEIDARRAHGLLDRAQHLAERGDLPASLLACRQAIALAHDESAGYSMLGSLLERAGDLSGAATAYEKSVELAPNSALDLESLKRLRQKMAVAAHAAQFQFNEDDLLATDTLPAIAVAPAADAAPGSDSESETLTSLEAAELHIDARLPPTRAEIESETGVVAKPAVVPVVPEALPAIPPVVAAPPVDALPVPVPVAPVASVPAWANPTPPQPGLDPLLLPPVRTSSSLFGVPQNAYGNERRAGDRRQLNMPVPVERRSGLSRRKSGKAAAPFAFGPLPDAAGMPIWAQLVRSPSFFGRTLPLVVITVLSLGFLGWARARAVSQVAATLPPVATSNDPIAEQPPAETITEQKPPSPNLVVPMPTAALGGGFPISNVAPGVPANVPNQVNVAPPSPTTGTRVAAIPRPATAHSRTSRSVPSFPSASIPPAAIVPGAGRQTNGNGPDLPPPQIAQQQVASPPIVVLPPGDGTTAVGSNPLNPAGSGRRNYIRIQQGRLGSSSLPQRPANQANNDEQQAANASRTGQTNQAIEHLSNAINSGNSNPDDVGFRLQQRANLFLEKNDYARAADDFQAAISAYQDQIDRGQNVSSARAGLRSARSGLNLALAGQRGG